MTRILQMVVALTMVCSLMLTSGGGGVFAAAPQTLTVGLSASYKTVGAAVAAAKDGDTIAITAGTYTETFTIDKSLKLVGVGGYAHIKAPSVIPNKKAIIVARGANVTLEQIELSGAKVPDKNGAGIRFEAGSLTLVKCYVHDNENGILAGSFATGTLTIMNSEFSKNGAGDGYTHGVYVGDIKSLTITDSNLHDTKQGHHVKSRARATTITNTKLDDGSGTASYNVDVPNGGVVVLRGNTLIQGKSSPNQTMVNFGGEGAAYAGSSLMIDGGTFTNYRTSGSVGVTNRTTMPVAINNASFTSVQKILDGPGTITPTPTTPTTPTTGVIVLSVGPKATYKTIGAAVAAAKAGDTIEVAAGTYAETFTLEKDVKIIGVGGYASIKAPSVIPNQKAIIVSRANVTLENIELSGAKVPDRNGAGIRFEKGNLTLTKCYIHDNEMGVLSGVIPDGTITVTKSEFAKNGFSGSSSIGHGLYIGDIKSAVVADSYFHDTIVGHHIKSRARSTTITNSKLDDGTADTSYNIDLPNGGVGVIRGNTLIQSKNSQNWTMVNYGGESAAYAGSSLLIENNTFTNYRSSSIGVKNHTTIPADVRGNTFTNVQKILDGAGTVTTTPTSSAGQAGVGQ